MIKVPTLLYDADISAVLRLAKFLGVPGDLNDYPSLCARVVRAARDSQIEHYREQARSK